MRRIIRSLLYTLACVGAVSLLAGARGNTAVAATTVSGYISADTTWTAANSPYSVSGNVIVRSGVTLTIEPGVTVNFGTGKSLQVDGTLIAKGTSAGKITFTGGSWAYILLSDTSIDATYDHSGNYVSGSILEYCVVEYAGGTSVSDNGAIRLNNAHPCINYCTIRNNSAPGIYAYNISGTLRITNSAITDNINASASYAYGAGVYVSHSSGGATTISGNTIKNNTASYYGGGIYTVSGTVTLTNNTISGNTASYCGGGIYTYNSTVTLTNNTISGNTVSSDGGSGGGGIYTSSSTVTLTNNTISGNIASPDGGGICLNYYSTVTLTNNTISGNTASSDGGGIYTGYSTMTLTNNTISGNTAKNAAAVDYNIPYYDGKDFKYNTITGNKATGGSDSCTIWVGSYSLFNYNNIYDNTATYELWFDKSQGSANLDAKNNWWGSSDETTIQGKIYDGIDSSTKALVDYYPYSTAIRTDTGVTVTTTPTPTPTVTTSPSPTPVVSPTPVTQSDVTAPVGSVSINSGASYTNSTTVTLNLSATDSVGVTGYYVATSSSTPLASASGWNSVTSATSYSGSVSYTLASGDEQKTVYVWFKDAAGNVSSTASDNIVLDTTAPIVTINSPTSSDTYTTTSNPLSLSGSASDSSSGVKKVMWSSDKGGSGTASGTTSWSVSSINLSNGDNTIIMTATDGAGNTSTDTLTITYNPITVVTPTPTTSPLPTLPPLPTLAPTLPPLPTPQVSPSPIQEGIVFGIVNDQDEQPLKGVTITITGKNSSDSTETDEDGYYEFGGLSQGTYALTYAKEGYQTQTQDVSLNEGELKDLGTVTMEQVVKGKISGYVANIKGDPIESVRLKLKGIKTKVIKTASSDADGFFEFTDLDADTYVIFAKKKGYKKTQQKVVLEEGESTEIEIEMRKTSKRIKGLLLEEDIQ